MAQHSNSGSAPKWPDLTVDNTAWEMAKAALGSSAPVSEIAQQAQRNKQALLAQSEDEIERARR